MSCDFSNKEKIKNGQGDVNWCVRQPGESDEREEALAGGGIDLLVVPGLAFTRQLICF